jgi:hypothetical protein
MKKLIIIGTAILLVACKIELPYQQPSPQWGAVNTRKIQEKIEVIIKQQNPPKETQNHGPTSREAATLEKNMSAMREYAESECRLNKPEPNGMPTPPTMCDRYAWCKNGYDEKCIIEIDKNPEIIALKSKIDAIEEERNKERLKQQAIQKLCAQKTQEEIIELAKKHNIQVMIDSSSYEPILYEPTGITMDLTNAALEQIRSKTYNLKMTDEQISQLAAQR